VLEREDHAGLLDAAERARFTEWLRDGAPLRPRGVHAPGVLDPRSREWHGQLAAADRFGPLLDPDHPGACGRCHDGAPVRPASVSRAAAAAPSCDSCHREPAGVLACGTCHGDGATRAHPPRDACLFGTQDADAHRMHVESTRLREMPLRCSDCHPRADASLRGSHGDGHVDVALEGSDATFDPETLRCAVSCHDRGGARARPAWDERGPLGCGDCHGSPPERHYPGACNDCHRDANADGSALVATELHMNGHTDVGDGSNDCGQCHGTRGDPMPSTPGHVLHGTTAITTAIACSECHSVPERVTSTGHLDRGTADPADVVFGPRARAFGRTPSYEAGTCREVACHGAGLPGGGEHAPSWDASSATPTCSSCHGAPPGQDHPQDPGCAAVLCHGSEVRAGTPGPRISDPGRALHIDGEINAGR
jgi:predicted CxxxxCH...CXXCH cytochrome family protein